jgi:hypothetical protein
MDVHEQLLLAAIDMANQKPSTLGRKVEPAAAARVECAART